MNDPELRVPLSEKFKTIASNVHFVLVEPESPGNVGSVARALKTMGFQKLVLVKPCPLDTPEMRMMAHRSIDIVRQARIVKSFDEIAGVMRLTAATTMRRRHFKFPFFTPHEIASRLLNAAIDQPVAIFFGRESSGLTNRELLQCQLHTTIPTATQNPALNLSQSVMIYAHTFFNYLNEIHSGYLYDLATQYELEQFYSHLESALNLVHFVPRDGLDSFINRFRRLIGRSMAEQRDVRLLHKLLQIFETRIQRLKKDPLTDDEDAIY